MRRRFFLGLTLSLLAGPATAIAGYTHYWTWTRPPEPGALRGSLAEMRRVTAAWPGKLEVAAEGDSLDVNGAGHEAHEPFVFPGRFGFNACKTQGKPYDEVVTALLL